jgi:hypothetical protein
MIDHKEEYYYKKYLEQEKAFLKIRKILDDLDLPMDPKIKKLMMNAASASVVKVEEAK